MFVVSFSQPTTASVKIVFCVAWAHVEGFPIATECALWLADSTKSKLHAACALLEDTTGCTGELKLIRTAYSVKRNSDSV